MTPDNLTQQVTKYLTDAHSIERQALAQMRVAPKLAGDESLAAAFREHLAETKEHDRLIAERLRARGTKPSPVKDAAGAAIGYGFVAFAISQPDTPGKLVVHGVSYEHMEEATYDLLGKVATRAGDEKTAQAAQRIETQERQMADRLAGGYDAAFEASLRKQSPQDMRAQLVKYLADAHAIETQSLQLLARAPKVVGADRLAAAYTEHRVETQEHERLVSERLRALGGSPSRVKDTALRLGALNWGGFFQMQPDTPVKLAGFSYALEHLEVGAYEMLRRMAARAEDRETQAVAERILGEEKAAAELIRSLFDHAVDVSLEQRGLVAA